MTADVIAFPLSRPKAPHPVPKVSHSVEAKVATIMAANDAALRVSNAAMNVRLIGVTAADIAELDAIAARIRAMGAKA